MNILIVDDDKLIRDSLTSVLQTYDMACVQAESVSEALVALDSSPVDCVLLDVLMPDVNGITLLKLIKERATNLPVIIMTGHADVPLAVQAMKDGAFEFMEKPLNDEVLAKRIVDACAHKLSKSQLDNERAQIRLRLQSLTPQERLVAKMVSEGFSTAAIADILKISSRTVDHHRAKILSKMQATSLPQMIKFLLVAFGE